jgi:hypothetical protein
LGTGHEAQLVEPSMCKSLGSIPALKKEQKERNEFSKLLFMFSVPYYFEKENV